MTTERSERGWTLRVIDHADDEAVFGHRPGDEGCPFTLRAPQITHLTWEDAAELYEWLIQHLSGSEGGRDALEAVIRKRGTRPGTFSDPEETPLPEPKGLLLEEAPVEPEFAKKEWYE